MIAAVEGISKIPAIINEIVTLAYALKGKRRESENIKELQSASNEVKETLKKLVIVGQSIRDYHTLSGNASYDNNRVNILKSLIPQVGKTGYKDELERE